MIERDRALLARLANANQKMGLAVLELTHHQNGGELPGEGLRSLGQHLTRLGADLLARADEVDALDGNLTESASTRVRIGREPQWR